jgi:hypothetical protein
MMREERSPPASRGKSLDYFKWLMGEIEFQVGTLPRSTQPAALLELAGKIEAAGRYARELAEQLKGRKAGE